MNKSEPFSVLVIEEIALEGLDGINFEDLCFRLSERLNIPHSFPENFYDDIWNFISNQEELQFYELPENRDERLVSIDRKKFFSTGDEDDPARKNVATVQSIYKFAPIEEGVIRGSCEHFHTRKEIEREHLCSLKVSEIKKKWKNKFVIVASQRLRELVLIPINICMETEITIVPYCLLERIGRARFFGEMTSGKHSLNGTVKDPAMLHYQKNVLLKHKLVNRQMFQQKIGKTTTSGFLLHLPRFYNAIRPHGESKALMIIDFLKTKPKFMAEYDEICELLKDSNKPLKRYLQLPELKQYISTNLKVPYRELYPNAKPDEYNFKSRQTEKILNVVQLLKPDVKSYEIFYKDDEEQEEKESGFLDNKNLLVGVPLLKQCYDYFEASKEEGRSQSEMAKYMGLSRLHARCVVRNLERLKYISSYMMDEGRQRVAKFFTKNYSQNRENFDSEISKLLTSATEITNKSENTWKRETKPHPNIIVQPIIDIDDNAKEFEFVPAPQPIIKSEAPVEQIIRYEEGSFVDNIEKVQVYMQFYNKLPFFQTKGQSISDLLRQNKLSTKLLHRMNFINNTIKIHTVIDSVNLLHILKREESAAGHKNVICRKSLFRMIGRLAADNFLKVVELEMKSVTKSVKVTYFGDVSVNAEHTIWQHIIEEEKLKNFVPASVPKSLEAAVTISAISANVGKFKALAESSVIEENGTMSYDNFPKFMKMKLFHELLFFLIYGYPEDRTKISINEAQKVWAVEQKNKSFTDVDCKFVYSTDIDWKMFIPPLNSHKDFGDGWGYLRDIIHRIPLIILVKIVRFIQDVPQIEEYLSHPIKCNYLLHFLPKEMREKLQLRRKYIFSIEELCKKLCFAGLLQFGPQRSKEKDQVYIFLNRNIVLWDTICSEPGYLHVQDKEYTVSRYYFDSAQAVINYWSDLFYISTNTKLNKRSTVIGKEVIIEVLSSKPSMIKALEAQTQLSAPLNDIGLVPGDRAGAAGLDSAFHAHLKQNWNRTLIKKTGKITNNKIKPTVVNTERKYGSRQGVSIPRRSTRKQARMIVKSTQQALLKGPLLQNRNKFVRTVNPVKKSSKQVAYDSVDKEALKLMKTLRVVWSDIEDITLTLCKVAIKFVWPNVTSTGQHFVNSTVIRDILHFAFPQSMNKTSRACQRRICYLLKNNPAANEKMVLYLEEIRTNRELIACYKNLVDNVKKAYSNNESVVIATRVHFVELVHKIHQIFRKANTSSNDSLILPNRIDKLRELYTISNPRSDIAKPKKYSDPLSIDDVEVILLSSLIHSAMCCSKDKTNYTLQLFDIYKNYKESSLSLAVSRLRSSKIIVVNKMSTAISSSGSKKVIEHSSIKLLPFAYSPFHLSILYFNQMNTSISCTLYSEYFLSAISLSSARSEKGQIELINVDTGTLFLISEMLILGKLVLSYEIPQNVVTVDPNMDKHQSVTYDRIHNRFQEILKHITATKITDIQLKKVKKAVSFHSNDEKFIFEPCPIEVFFKCDSIVLHVFCFLNNINEAKPLHNYLLNEDMTCNVKHCILSDSSHFMDNCVNIAYKNQKLLVSILSENVPENEKFFQLFEGFLKKYENEKPAKFGEKIVVEMHPKRKFNAKSILQDVLHLIQEKQPINNFNWIMDYQKKFTSDDDDLDEDIPMETFEAPPSPQISDKYDSDSMDASNKTLKKKLANRMTEFDKRCNLNDMFVINISKCFVRTKNRDLPIPYDGLAIHSSFIPFEESLRDILLEKIKGDSIWNRFERATTDLQDKLKTQEIVFIIRNQCNVVLEYIEQFNEMGCNAYSLLEKFKDKDLLQQCVSLLQEHQYVLRTGVNDIIFVHHRFTSHWLIETYHVKRLERESMVSNDLPKKRKVAVITKRKSDDDNVESKRSKIADDCQPSTSKNVDGEPIAKRLKIEREGSSRSLARQRAIQEKNEKQLKDMKEKTREYKSMKPFPWIRVNGTLNRRVLDRWLSVILTTVCEKPGVTLQSLQAKFSCVQPFDIRYLVETLEKIGCVQLMALHEPKVSLLSNFENIKSKNATVFDSPDTSYLEICQDAMLKLSFFIGNKKYKTEFI